MYIFGHLRQSIDFLQYLSYSVAQLPECVHKTVESLIYGSGVHLNAREQTFELGTLLLTQCRIDSCASARG